MTHAHPEAEGAPEQATLALFRDLGWRTVNGDHEVYADAPGGYRSDIEEGEESVEDKRRLGRAPARSHRRRHGH
jgi:hypothetical protein